MQKSTMKWDDLRVFLAVARHGRLHNAGRTLGLDPATVGRRIAALEEALGARLFDRSPQGYAITEAGRGLLAHAQAMESQASAATEEIGGQADRLSGTVRIGAPDGVSNYLLIDACDALSRDNPDLQVQVVALPRMFSLSKREADLAITVSPPSAGRLTVRKIADYRLHLYGRADLIAGLGPVARPRRPARGARHRLHLRHDLRPRARLLRAARARDRSVADLEQPDGAAHWCRRGFGVCILPDFVARAHAELVAVLADDIRLTRAFYLVRHEDDARVARINRMAEVVVDWMRQSLDEHTA